MASARPAIYVLASDDLGTPMRALEHDTGTVA
jgi:hypothetical protein